MFKLVTLRILLGSLFHTAGAAILKELSPNVFFDLVDGVSKRSLWLDRRLQLYLEFSFIVTTSFKYSGDGPYNTLNVNTPPFNGGPVKEFSSPAAN